MLILYNTFQKIETERLLLTHSEASITLILGSDKDITRKLQTNISHEHRCKNLQQNIRKSNPVNVDIELYSKTKWKLSQICKVVSTFENQLM